MKCFLFGCPLGLNGASTLQIPFLGTNMSHSVCLALRCLRNNSAYGLRYSIEYEEWQSDRNYPSLEALHDER